MKERNSSCILMVAILVFSLLPVQPVEAAKKVTVKKVVVASSLSGDVKTVVVAKGKKVKLTTTVTVTPNKLANKKVTYKSADKKIASVSNKGVVKGVKKGSTKITVTSKKNSKKKTTIKVKVVNGAVTKVKLDQKSGNINVGDKVVLKATVSAKKGADKTLAWKSSDKAVVTVDKKGNVTAVGPGNAKVTAQAIDGSGKKAVYTVTVQDPIYLTGMNVVNSRSVTFSLNKPLALQANNISVMKKKYQKGTYQNMLVIDNISTTDNVNYSVVLTDESEIGENEYVQLSVPGLNGAVKSMETIYSSAIATYTDDEVITLPKGMYYNDEFSFDYVSDAVAEEKRSGYAAYTVENLPAGLSAESKNGKVIIKGVPTVSGVYVATLKATDELGNTLTKSLTFSIYADDVLVAAAPETYILFSGDSIPHSQQIEKVGVGKSQKGNYKLYTGGGSGYYTYSVTSDPNGIVTNKDGNGRLKDENIEIKISSAGDYVVTVRVQDMVNTALWCDVVVKYHVMQGITIGGCVLDASGNRIPGVKVRLENKDKGSKCTVHTGNTNYDTGVYGIAVLPGTYDITVSYSSSTDDEMYISKSAQATKYLYNQVLTASQTGFDIQLPLYKVTLVEPVNEDGNKINLSGMEWYYNHEYVGKGTSLYLKAGNYVIDSEEIKGGFVSSNTIGDWFNGTTTMSIYTNYKYTANVNVTNASIQVAVSKVGLPDCVEKTYAKGAKNTTLEAKVNTLTYLSYAPYAAYFVPDVTGSYSTGNGYLYFWDANGNNLGASNVSLMAGQKYFVANGYGEAGSYFTITQNN